MPADAAPDFAFEPSATRVADDARSLMLVDPGWGRVFTDHMAIACYEVGKGWHDAKITARRPLSIDPATSVLHYAQEIFEGLKAYRRPGRGFALFRPDANARRFNASARRMAMPDLPEAMFLESIRALVRADRAWIPDSEEGALYLRPFMFATEIFLGVKPASAYYYIVLASSVGAYFKGASSISLWATREYVRAAPGGTGEAKCGGNYATSLIATDEAISSLWATREYVRAAPGGTGEAKGGGNYAPSLIAQAEAIRNGCDQVVFLDAVERRWVEELGGMNIFFVFEDGSLATPPLGGTILAGITRDW